MMIFRAFGAMVERMSERAIFFIFLRFYAALPHKNAKNKKIARSDILSTIAPKAREIIII